MAAIATLYFGSVIISYSGYKCVPNQTRNIFTKFSDHWSQNDMATVFRSSRWLQPLSYCISLQQAEITREVLTERFSSSTAVVHRVSYPASGTAAGLEKAVPIYR